MLVRTPSWSTRGMTPAKDGMPERHLEPLTTGVEGEEPKETRELSMAQYTYFARQFPWKWNEYGGPWMPLSGLTLSYWGYTLKWDLKSAAQAAFWTGWEILIAISLPITGVVWRMAILASRKPQKSFKARGDQAVKIVTHRSLRERIRSFIPWRRRPVSNYQKGRKIKKPRRRR